MPFFANPLRWRQPARWRPCTAAHRGRALLHAIAGRASAFVRVSTVRKARQAAGILESQNRMQTNWILQQPEMPLEQRYRRFRKRPAPALLEKRAATQPPDALQLHARSHIRLAVVSTEYIAASGGDPQLGIEHHSIQAPAIQYRGDCKRLHPVT